MYTWRITKYNPLFRDENGRYLGDDWTSIADIRKILQSNNGQPVTVEDYQSIEDTYIEAQTHMFVHFGWDYYMYIGATETCELAIERVRQSGMFVEPMASPYSEE